jgi:hypothetical protein
LVLRLARTKNEVGAAACVAGVVVDGHGEHERLRAGLLRGHFRVHAACHRSQMARSSDSSFSPLADLMRLQARACGTQAGVGAAEAFRAHLAFKRARAW